MLSIRWTDTPYTIAAAPFFRLVYVLVMMKQYFNQCINPGGGVFEAYIHVWAAFGVYTAVKTN